jgi:flagellar basal-body rod protein FlgG
MLRGLYIAGGGMTERSVNLEILNNNIANIQTNSFKRDRVAYSPFKETLMRRIQDNAKPVKTGMMPFGTEIKPFTFTDFSQGPLTPSGDSQDLSLEGKGFFKIMLQNGETRYTRDGHYMILPDGSMVDRDGNFFLDDQDRKIVISQNGELMFTPAGEIFQDKAEIGRIGVFEINDLSVLAKDGDIRYRLDGDASIYEQDAQGTDVLQGYTERANCSPVGLITEMITLLREYEANQKVVQAFDETTDEAIRTLGSPLGG